MLMEGCTEYDNADDTQRYLFDIIIQKELATYLSIEVPEEPWIPFNYLYEDADWFDMNEFV